MTHAQAIIIVQWLEAGARRTVTRYNDGSWGACDFIAAESHEAPTIDQLVPFLDSDLKSGPPIPFDPKNN